MRKQFINNIRWFVVFMLVPYHAACVYRTTYLGFFISFQGKHAEFFEYFVFALALWIMPMLFALAGASAVYAIEKRSIGEFVKERIKRLLIPLIVSTILLSPIQMYISNLYHGVYVKGYFWRDVFKFFTSDSFGGYTGGFSYTGFWFIRHLFFMSILLIPFLWLYVNKGSKFKEVLGKFSIPMIMLFAFLPAEGYAINYSDYSFYEFAAWFLLGAVVLTNDEIINKLSKNCWLLMAIMIVGTYFYCWAIKNTKWYTFVIWTPCSRLLRWECILAVVGLFKRCFDKENGFTRYMTDSSYGYYIFHQTILIVVGYFTIVKLRGPFQGNDLKLYAVTVGATWLLTFAAYEIVHRIPVVRGWIGYKPKKKN